MPTSETTADPLIESRIFLIRGQKVLLDADLAALYEVETRALDQAVKRKRERFPEDFMFQLTPAEADADALRSQMVMSNAGGRGGRRYLPYALTEQGMALLSSVLTSVRALEVHIAVRRTFVRLRQRLVTQEELAQQRAELRGRQEEQEGKVPSVFEAMQQRIEAPAEIPSQRRIGLPTSQTGREHTE